MAVNEEALSRLINGNTKKLCGNNNLIEQAAVRNNTNSSPFGDPDPASFDDDFGSLYSDPSFNISTTSTGNIGSGDISYDAKAADKSKLPSFIKESMLQNKIDVEAMDNISVAAEQKFKNLSRSKEIMYEGKTPINNKPQNGVVGLSKELFFSWLDEYFSKHDNVLKTIALKGGNINLIDNSGNIYSAKLKKIENKDE